MIIRSLSQSEVARYPNCVWNAYVDLLAMEDYQSLSTVQRLAYLVFWYDSEVQNGGHLQYFENHGTRYLNQTIKSLKELGALQQQQILHDAGQLWMANFRNPIQTIQEYSATALLGEFDLFDADFYNSCPTLQDCLESFLALNQSEFVRIN